MTRDELKALERKDLKEIAQELGVDLSKDTKNDQLIDKILKVIEALPEAEDVMSDGEEGDDASDSTAEVAAKLDEVLGGDGLAEPLKGEEAKAAAVADQHVATQAAAPIPVAKEDAVQYPSIETARKYLQSYVNRGLIIEHMNDVFWQFRCHNRQASGTMKMPLKQMLMQANIILKPTATPTSEGNELKGMQADAARRERSA